MIPTAAQVARAWALGGMVLALSNAAAIAVSVPLPQVQLRLLHHFFDALHAVSLGALAALVAALASRGAKRFRFFGWGLYIVGCTWAMHALMDQTLIRQSIVWADKMGFSVPGSASKSAHVVFLILLGLAVPAAHWGVGFLRWLEFKRGFFWAQISLAVLLILAGHLIFRDEYEDVHTAFIWPAVILCGSALEQRVGERLSTFHWRLWLPLGVLVAGLGLLLPTPNAVRQQLFRSPGAVASFALARTVWKPIELSGSASASESVAREVNVRVSSSPPIRPNPVVVLLTVDALRADVLIESKYEGRFPHLSRLRDQGAFFTSAISPGSQTAVVFSSIFSGRYFSQLRWHWYGSQRTRRLYPAADATPRVVEALTAHGVKTFSYLSPNFLRDDFGIARGFAKEKVFRKAHAHARDVMAALSGDLAKHGDGSGFFFAHLLDAHEPYNRGKLKTGTAKERYLSEIELVDTAIGKLWKLLQRKFPDRATLIVTADHGEAFGEHNSTFHSKNLYQELIHVPLIVVGPGAPPRRISETVSLLDIGPTLLEWFAASSPTSSMGQSLRPLLLGEDYVRVRPVAAEGRLRRALLLKNGLKAIEDRRHKFVEVYDLRVDPKELDNLVTSAPERAAPAVATLRRVFAEIVPLPVDGYEAPYKR